MVDTDADASTAKPQQTRESHSRRHNCRGPLQKSDATRFLLRSARDAKPTTSHQAGLTGLTVAHPVEDSSVDDLIGA